MALQGTLDTFELPDVLRLLASTKKSGRLHLHGDRGDGDVWLTDGQVIGVEAGGAAEVADALFELLRAHTGTFAFEPGEAPAAEAPSLPRPLKVEPLLAEVESKLTEWRAIEAVVPSLEAWVALASELGGPEVTVSADTWRVVATVGSGLPVGELGRVLGLGEVAVSSLVRDLVEQGLGSVTAAPAHAAPVAVEPTGTAVAEPAAYQPLVADERPPLFTAETPVTYADPEPAPFEPPVVAGIDPVEGDPVEADEVSRQLAMLSPRAAEAVAAAAASGSEEERRAALAAVDEGDEPVNRGLLLKFLSSVKS